MSDTRVSALDSQVLRSTFMAWLVCLSAGLFFFYEFFQLNLFDVINEPLRDAFQLNASQLSFMSSTYLWADIIFLVPAGLILDRFSVRTVILSAMFICVLGTVGFATTQSFWLASFFHFLSGIGNAFCFLSCVVLVSRWFPPRRQALVMGMIVTLAFLGGTMAHSPLAYLNDHFGWRHSLLIDGAVGALLLLWIYAIVKDMPMGVAQSFVKTNTSLSDTLKVAIKNPQNLLTGIYTSCLNLPIMVLCALWGASYLQVVHHLSEMSASHVVSLIFIGSIIGCPLVGFLSDKIGRRKPIMWVGAIATLLIMVPLFTGYALSESMLSIIFFSLGFFTSAQVISYPLIAESNALNSTGAATSIASVIIMGGGGVGQVVYGLLMQHHAGSGVVNYNLADFQFAMWMFPITVLVAIAALYWTRETHCKRS